MSIEPAAAHFQESGTALPRLHAVSSISAMYRLVEGGVGIATLPRAAVEHLGRRAPVHILRSDVALPPLPIHASYREDPSSNLTETVLNSAINHVASRAS